ncbi:hypothetical protein ELQ94_00090 [Labedella endophytica]|uniref:Restriction endonuclease n=2 Tax=Labedella endophytica TaxID=1523160 RepID=A0A3S0XAB6_9MICO|nr:hypothetical protein ELQ94_00090 [Labedella endophytica]
MQHQAKLAEQRQRAASREYEARRRAVEQANRAAERAQAAATRASEADRKRLEKEAIAAYVAAMQAGVEQRNADLQEQYAEIDGLLSATLAVDDFVDLEQLRVRVQHPAFPRPDLRAPLPVPAPIPDPPLPVQHQPAAPTGLFGKKKKWADAQAAAAHQYAQDYYVWQAATASLPQRRAAQADQYAAAEKQRQLEFSRVETRYAQESAERDAAAAAQNAELDELISGLAYGAVDAVQEYVSIVLANSVYPEWFPVSHSAVFDPSSAELSLRVSIPGPDKVPTVKAYRYVRASDEVTSSPLPQKDLKERYSGVVHNVALRSMHEIFEADRRGLIRAISLELGTETTNPATGRETYVPFVAAAVTRDLFMELDLSAVVPSATLEHLGAVVSKNPFSLAAITPGGVRKV